MNLTEEKIKKNGTKFFETCDKYGIDTNKLVDLLGIEFIGAPSATNTDLGNAFAGGLIKHILTVTKYMVSLNEILPKPLELPIESVIKVGLLHQIGKSELFKVLDSSWHNQRGIMYEFNNDLPSMKVSERSVEICVASGIQLTTDEFRGILNFDKEDSDKQSKYHNSIVGVLLRSAVALTNQEEQYNG